MTFVPPFDVQYWLLNVFSGSLGIFIGVALIVIAGLAAYFKMSNSIFFISVFLFTLLMGTFISEFFIIAIVMAGLFVAYSLSRLYAR